MFTTSRRSSLHHSRWFFENQNFLFHWLSLSMHIETRSSMSLLMSLIRSLSLERCVHHLPKPITKWLSDETIFAKREQFKRCKSTCCESDSINFRRVYHQANKLIDVPIVKLTNSSMSHGVHTSTLRWLHQLWTAMESCQGASRLSQPWHDQNWCWES